jgi:hypothetical protein
MGMRATHTGDKESFGLAENIPACLSFFICHCLIAILCGVVIVVTPFELLFFIVPAWMIAGGVLFSASRKLNQGLRVAAILLIQSVTVFAVVIAAANYRPAKTRELMQDQLSATLPQSTMSLNEIKAFVEEGNRDGFLRMIQFADQETDLQAEVSFSDRHITLREFITEINRQTAFDARLAGGCGNGSTILCGVAPYYVMLSRR